MQNSARKIQKTECKNQKGGIGGESRAPAAFTQRSHHCHSNVSWPDTEEEWHSEQEGAQELWWKTEDARGQIFAGECLQVAIGRIQQMKVKVDLIPYMGMYGPGCNCSWCLDRKMKQGTEKDLKHKRSVVLEDESGAQSSRAEEMTAKDKALDKTLRRGVSAVQLPGKERQWKTQTYAVRQGVVNDILSKMNAGVPSIDAFANKENARFDRHWGEGGVASDAWKQDWSKERLMWCNPPYSDLAEVFYKIRKDSAKAIVVVPDWRDQDWFSEMWKMTRRSYYYPAGRQVFELPNQEVPPTRWGVWAVLVDGSYDADVDAQGWQQKERKISRSSRRRQRRVQQQTMEEACGVNDLS